LVHLPYLVSVYACSRNKSAHHNGALANTCDCTRKVSWDTDYTGCKLFVNFLSPPNKMLKSDHHRTLTIHSDPSFSNDATTAGHEGVWGSKGVAPLSITSVLDWGEWSASRFNSFIPGETDLGSEWTRGFVGPTAGLDKNVFPLSGIESWYLGRPVCISLATTSTEQPRLKTNKYRK